MQHSLKQYFIGRINSFKYAFAGLVYLVGTQKNGQIHVVATIFVILAGFIFQLTLVEFSLIFICIGIVWVSELINTAIESLVDLCSPEYHPAARASKDLGAAAVLIGAVVSVVVGVIIFFPHLIASIKR